MTRTTYEAFRCPECGAISDVRWHMQEHRDRRNFFSRHPDGPEMCRGGGRGGVDAEVLMVIVEPLPALPTRVEDVLDPRMVEEIERLGGMDKIRERRARGQEDDGSHGAY